MKTQICNEIGGFPLLLDDKELYALDSIVKKAKNKIAIPIPASNIMSDENRILFRLLEMGLLRFNEDGNNVEVLWEELSLVKAVICAVNDSGVRILKDYCAGDYDIRLPMSSIPMPILMRIMKEYRQSY